MAASLESVAKRVANEIGVDEIKQEQIDILRCLVERQDCVAVLPTGYGKSLPYQMYHRVMKGLGREPKTIIVCCPLVSLMEDQVKRMSGQADVTTAFKGGSDETDTLILDGQVDVLFASPEALVGESQLRDQLLNFDVSTIVVDEFHTVCTWGGLDKEEEEKVFRKWFRHIGELRSLFPAASVLALSATCTTIIKNRLMKVLNLNEYTKYVSVSPNKKNIKFVVCKVPTDLESAMFWLIEALSSMKEMFPRTLIYCQSIKDVSLLYNYLVTELDFAKEFVEMFHSETPVEKKKDIVSRLGCKSQLRLVVSTSALGMGIDVDDCNNIIMFGPPKSVVDLLQAVGRAGRDGSDSVAIIMYNSYQKHYTDEEVQDVINTTVCRRLAVMSCFCRTSEMEELRREVGTHTCCDLCSKGCQCDNCCMIGCESFMLSVSYTECLEEHASDDV